MVEDVILDCNKKFYGHMYSKMLHHKDLCNVVMIVLAKFKACAAKIAVELRFFSKSDFTKKANLPCTIDSLVILTSDLMN